MGSSSENCCCVVCEFSIDVSSTLTPVRTIEYITEISGRPVKDLLGGLFTQDYELLVKLEKRPKRNSPSSVLHVCEVCFALLEQIDAFEHNLTKLRLDLTARRGSASIAHPGTSVEPGCEENGQGSFPTLGDDGNDCLDDVLKTIKQVSLRLCEAISARRFIIFLQDFKEIYIIGS